MVYSIRRTVVKVIDGDTVQVARKIDGVILSDFRG